MMSDLRTRAVCVLLALPALLACARAEQETEAKQAPLVEAVEARQGSLPIEEVVPGTVRARNQVLVRPEIEARVVAVLARSGEAVRQPPDPPPSVD